MIEIKIKAENYRVAEAMADAERLIKNGSLDVIYDEVFDEVNYVGDYYRASFKYAKGEELPSKQENEEQIDALKKLSDMDNDEFNKFMRSIGLFEETEYVDWYNPMEIGEIIDNANNGGYSINIKIENLHDNFIHVKYIDSPYCKSCVVNGLSDNNDEWCEYFKFEKIAKDYAKEIINF